MILQYIILILTAIFAFGYALDAMRSWRRCPHGKFGGMSRGRCLKCEKIQVLAAEEQRRRAEQQERERARKAAREDLRCREATRLAKSLVPNLQELRGLTPYQFEDEVARMFQRLGYTVQQTPYSNDQGRDAILRKEGKKYLVECKRYGRDQVSGREDIQKFHSAIITEHAVKGFFVTTGGFSKGAIEYSRKISIELVDCDNLLVYLIEIKSGDANDNSYKSMCIECNETVQHLLRSPDNAFCSRGHLIQPTLTIDDVLHASEWIAPRCVKCDAPMRLINGRKGKFWGCSAYPNCRSTQPFRAPTSKRHEASRQFNDFSRSRSNAAAGSI